ncbi:MAG: N-acetyltransferase family protein [Methanoregula sp.]|jgi:phosphinothricin acetyltransferase|nr:N-acetyltransferase family protein [Methanoregula sp.]
MKNEIRPPDTAIVIRKPRNSDREAILAIFNHYAATSYAAYPDMPVNDRFYEFLQEGTLAFYVLARKEQVVGFGLIKPLLPFPVFMKTGMLTYFLLPEFTGQGLGKRLLEQLTRDASKLGMTSLVANMASKNIPSIHFHVRNGFTEVGRLQNAGMKFDELFDLVWMQKML